MKFTQPSRTKQSHKNECDINQIINTFKRTGYAPQPRAGAQYGYASAASFHEGMCLVAETSETFSQLPAQLRKKFNNNPHELLEFLENPDNAAEAYQLGITNTNPETKTNKKQGNETSQSDSTSLKNHEGEGQEKSEKDN